VQNSSTNERMRRSSARGGDFYDCFMLDGSTSFFLVGDVSARASPRAFHGACQIAPEEASHCAADATRGDLNQANAEISRDNPIALRHGLRRYSRPPRTGRLAFCSAAMTRRRMPANARRSG